MKERKINGGVIVGLLESDLDEKLEKTAEAPAEEKPKRAGRKKAD